MNGTGWRMQCRQCTLPGGMGLFQRKQPDWEGIFPSATVPSLLETITAMALASAVTAALKQLSYFHENPLKTNNSNSACARPALWLCSTATSGNRGTKWKQYANGALSLPPQACNAHTHLPWYYLGMSSSAALSCCHTMKATSVKFYKLFVLDNITLLTLCFYLTISKPTDKSICHFLLVSWKKIQTLFAVILFYPSLWAFQSYSSIRKPQLIPG